MNDLKGSRLVGLHVLLSPAADSVIDCVFINSLRHSCFVLIFNCFVLSFNLGYEFYIRFWIGEEVVQ